MRCVKARIVSWLNSDKVGATLPVGDGGQYIILAIYENGKYVKPETVTIPNGVPADWGPDGPVQYGPVQAPPEDETEEGTDGSDG